MSQLLGGDRVIRRGCSEKLTLVCVSWSSFLIKVPDLYGADLQVCGFGPLFPQLLHGLLQRLARAWQSLALRPESGHRASAMPLYCLRIVETALVQHLKCFHLLLIQQAYAPTELSSLSAYRWSGRRLWQLHPACGCWTPRKPK